jgi:hypothetical protein
MAEDWKWTPFDEATKEIEQALAVDAEKAQSILWHLCADGEVLSIKEDEVGLVVRRFSTAGGQLPVFPRRGGVKGHHSNHRNPPHRRRWFSFSLVALTFKIGSGKN